MVVKKGFLFSVLVLSSMLSQAADSGSKPGADAEHRLSADESIQATENFRTPMTVRECQKQGGFVVGDPGDGRIHRSDYRCLNQQAPLGVIVPIEEGPVDIEGAVCCGTSKK